MLPDLYRTTRRTDIPDRGLAAREGKRKRLRQKEDCNRLEKI